MVTSQIQVVHQTTLCGLSIRAKFEPSISVDVRVELVFSFATHKINSGIFCRTIEPIEGLLQSGGGACLYGGEVDFPKQFSLGNTPVLLSVIFTLSVQMYFVGILEETNGAIHAQIQPRPWVIERERLNFDEATPDIEN